MGMFIREKKIHCGKEHMEVDIYQLGDAHKKKSKSRKREQVTAPAQKNLNDKRARRYMRQLVKTNFTTGDLHISCTYRNSHLPDTLEEGKRKCQSLSDVFSTAGRNSEWNRRSTSS